MKWKSIHTSAAETIRKSNIFWFQLIKTCKLDNFSPISALDVMCEIRANNADIQLPLNERQCSGCNAAISLAGSISLVNEFSREKMRQKNWCILWIGICILLQFWHQIFTHSFPPTEIHNTKLHPKNRPRFRWLRSISPPLLLNLNFFPFFPNFLPSQ